MMSMETIGPRLIYDLDGDDTILLDERYNDVSLYIALERAGVYQHRLVFDQLMTGPSFMCLLRRMAITKVAGMGWTFFPSDVFVDSN